MMEKQYEKTGIKEQNKKREKQSKMEEKKQHQQEIQKAIKRGFYKESRKDYYDLSGKNYQKEYQKVKNLLADYKDTSNENIKTLILGYRDYLDTYGNEMSAKALRDFRRGVLNTISNAKKALIKKDITQEAGEKKKASLKVGEKQLVREDVILDFCINHHLELKEVGLDIGMLHTLMISLIDKGVPPKDGDDIGKIRAKVKSIHNELKKL